MPSHVSGGLLFFLASAALAQPTTPRSATQRTESPIRQVAATVVADTVWYDVFLGGRPGSQVSWWNEPDGTVTLLDETRDRGRGAQSRWNLRFDDSGTPVNLVMTGRDEWGRPVRRRVSIDGDSMTWENGDDRHVRPVHRDAFYVPWTLGSTLDYVVLTKAFARNRPVAIVRGYNAEPQPLRLRTITRTRVQNGATQLEFALLALMLGDRTVSRMWVDDAGDLIAIIGLAPVTVRRGFDWAVPALIDAQDSLVAPRMAEAAARAWQRPPGGIAITGANVIDVEAGMARPNTTVLVQGERITAVGADGTVPIPTGARVIDARGLSLVPGLWDMHRHAFGFRDDAQSRRALAEGVTTQRDLLSTTFNTFDALRNFRRAAANQILGPRYIMAGGFIDGPGAFTAPTRAVATNEVEALRWVNTYADSGFEQIKVYNSLDHRLIPAIATEAHRRGLRLSGHVPAFMNAEQAVRAGFDEIQHIHYVLLNFLGADTLDVRGTSSVDIVASRGASVDLSSGEVARFIELLKSRNVAVDVTLVWQEATLRALPAASPDARSLALHALEKMKALTALLHRNGVRLLAGTDARGTISRELELYVEAGIPSIDAIRIATLDAATHAGRGDHLGSITVGKLADLVLVAGDPLADIGRLRRIEVLIKGGAILDGSLLAVPLEW